MATNTTYYNLIKPAVNDPTDQDLWGGYLNEDMDIIDTALNTIATTAGRLPVGSIYMNANDATNPSALLGYGTWAALGAGRVLVGVGTGTDGEGNMETFSAEDEGGLYEVELTIDEIPEHTHGLPYGSNAGSQAAIFRIGQNLTTIGSAVSDATGGGDPHDNKQPYLAVYMWVRTV